MPTSLDVKAAPGETYGSGPLVLVDVARAAQHLGTPVRFIRRLVAERRIRFYKVGRYVRIDIHDLDTFVAEGCVEALRPAGQTTQRAPR